MRLSFVALLVYALTSTSCTSTSPLPLPGVSAATDGDPSDASSSSTAAATSTDDSTPIEVDPANADGTVGPVVRFTWQPISGLPAGLSTKGHVLVIEGAIDDAEVAALPSARDGGALAKRAVPTSMSTSPPTAPDTLTVQPTRPLQIGSASLLVVDGKKVVRRDVTILDAPIAARAWPIATAATSPTDAWIYCAPSGAIPTDLATTVDVGTNGATFDVQPRADAPCIALTPRAPNPLGTLSPPPAIPRADGDAWLLDPTPVSIADPSVASVEAAVCDADETLLAGLCIRVDDDRATLRAASAGILVIGRITQGATTVLPLLASLDPTARFVLKGLTPSMAATLAAEVWPGPTQQSLTFMTAPARAHLVVNEALDSPPSGVVTQRFVELVNDGAAPIALNGLSLVDATGGAPTSLTGGTIAPGAFVLVVPFGFVDGLDGDVAPVAGVARVSVDRLPMTTTISVVDSLGAVLSEMPLPRSTKHASQDRRTPSTPDDADDAFGWDANDSATPGAPNVVAAGP